jgi:RES domain
MSDPSTSVPSSRVGCFRAGDRRFPFLWATSEQPPGRWHDTGEGPCHYLASTAKGAWAEVVRHEEITDADDLADLELTLWAVEAFRPLDVPKLDTAALTGGPESYPACQDEARRLRAEGALGLVAPSAAVMSGRIEQYGVGPGGRYLVELEPTEDIVLFGAPDGLTGMPLAEGHPELMILTDVRPL